QLPPATLDAVHAGLRLQRARDDARSVCARDFGGLPVLLLWRCVPLVSGACGQVRGGDAPPDDPSLGAGRTRLAFTVAATDGAARTGEISLSRGVTRTPAFMPVGTAGTVKAMLPETVRALGSDIILANTYHLMLRPGAERVAALGGLHVFAN